MFKGVLYIVKYIYKKKTLTLDHNKITTDFSFYLLWTYLCLSSFYNERDNSFP